MTDENTQVVEEEVTPEVEGVNEDNQPAGGSRTFTQEEVDKLIKDRLRREHEKYKDYDDTKKTAEQLAAEKAEAEKRAEEAETKAAELAHKVELEQWKKDAAQENGVPAEILKGATEEEIREHAESIKAALAQMSPMPTAPVVPNDAGGVQAVSMSKAEILAIKDEKERKAAIAANLDAFL